MSISAGEKIFLVVALADFTGIFISIGVALYLSYTKMDLMLGCFKNSPFVINLSLLLGSGWWGRLYVMGGITSVLVFPHIYLRDGGAIASDIESFPIDLKRRLILMCKIDCSLFLVMCGLIVVTNFRSYIF